LIDSDKTESIDVVVDDDDDSETLQMMRH